MRIRPCLKTLAFALLILLSAQPAFGQEAPPSPGRKLRLDGQEASVTLQRDLFLNRKSATVEGWIRFEGLGSYSRFFDVGRAFNSIAVTHFEQTPNLMYEAWISQTNRAAIHIIGLIHTNEWSHIAAVSGPGGMKLFFNGMLISTNSSSIGFSKLRKEGAARLGRSVWDQGNARLHGAVSDIRLWDHALSASEINEGMFSPPTGAPDGLIGHWMLDGSLSNRIDGSVGQMEGLARYTRSELPDPADLPHPAIINGLVTDDRGMPLNLLQVRLRTVAKQVLAAGRTGTSAAISDSNKDICGPGRFDLAIYATNDPVDLLLIGPQGSLEVKDLIFDSGERRQMKFVVPTGNPSVSTTNMFVSLLVHDLQHGDPWLRQMAANDLVAMGDFSNASAALVAAATFDPDPQVRSDISRLLGDLSRHSPMAVAAMIENAAQVGGPQPDDLRRVLRNRPIPPGLRQIYTRKTFAVAMLFAGIIGAFSLLHGFFFLCDRKKISDGIYSIFTAIGAAGTLLTDWGRGGNADLVWIGPALLTISYSVGLLLFYLLFSQKVPRRYWVLNACTLVVGFQIYKAMRDGAPSQTLQAITGLIGLITVIEMIRSAWRAYKEDKPGSALIGGGLLVFIVCQTMAPIVAAVAVSEVFSAWLYPLGMCAMVVCTSLHLAREYVKTYRALREASEKIARNESRLTAEIEEASAYVRSLLPAPLKEGPVQTSYVFQPSMRLGGDAFGYHWLDEHRFAIYLIDACGHGVGSALLSVSALNAMRSQTLPDADFGDPADVLGALNRAFPMEAHHQQYFTAWYGVFDRRNRVLCYGSAGHPPAYLMDGPKPPAPLRTPSPPIGALANPTFGTACVQIPPGGLLQIVSDGVYELVRPDGRAASLKDYEKALAAKRWNTPQQVLEWARSENASLHLEDDFSVVHAVFA